MDCRANVVSVIRIYSYSIDLARAESCHALQRNGRIFVGEIMERLLEQRDVLGANHSLCGRSSVEGS
jgi:hypothetical protein